MTELVLGLLAAGFAGAIVGGAAEIIDWIFEGLGWIYDKGMQVIGR